MLEHNFTDPTKPDTYITGAHAREAEQEQSDAIDAQEMRLATLETRVLDAAEFEDQLDDTWNWLTESNLKRLPDLTTGTEFEMMNLTSEKSRFGLSTVKGNGQHASFKVGNTSHKVTTAATGMTLILFVWNKVDLLVFNLNTSNIEPVEFTSLPASISKVEGSTGQVIFSTAATGAKSYKIIVQKGANEAETIDPAPPAYIANVADFPIIVWFIAVDAAGNEIPCPVVGVGQLLPAALAQVLTITGNQSIAVGGNATLSATISGVETPTPQWEKSTDGGTTYVPITGATTLSVTINNVLADIKVRLKLTQTNFEEPVYSEIINITTQRQPQLAPTITNQDNTAKTYTFTIAAGKTIANYEITENYTGSETDLYVDATSNTVPVSTSAGFVYPGSKGVRLKGDTYFLPSGTTLNTITFTKDHIVKNLTMTNASYGAGKFGQGLTGGYGLLSSITVPDSWTLEGWASRASSSITRVVAGCDRVFFYGTKDDHNNACLDFGDYGNGNGKSIATSVNILDGTFKHFAAVFGITETRLYVNGTLVGSSAFALKDLIPSKTFPLAIGDMANNLGNGFDGNIDHIIITPGEKYTANFTPDTSGTVPNTATIAVYEFENNGNDTGN